MRASTKEMTAKAHGILKEGIPIRAKNMAQKCGMSVSSVYNMVRRMRVELSIPVMPTKNGYLLAEHATKRDDVYLLRRMNGRHTSDSMTVWLCQGSILKRWQGIENKEVKQICESFSSVINKLNRNKIVLLKQSGKL